MQLGSKAIQQKKPNQDDNLIPLINIVFLMLIFFMVAGQISQSDPIKVKPPASVSKQHTELKPLRIVVSTDGRIAVGQVEVSEEELTAAITKHFEQADDPHAFSLLVKVDANLAVEKLQHILSLIKQSGIKKITLATQKQGTPS